MENIRDLKDKLHKTEQELNRYKNLIDSFSRITSGMLQVEPDGEHIRFNKKLRDILGYNGGEAEELNLEKIIHNLTTQRDITRQYLDMAAVMMLALNEDQTVSDINAKGCEILGLPKHEIIGKNWFDNFLPQREITDVKEVFNKIISGNLEPVEYYESYIIRPDGTERNIAWHNSVLHSNDGSIFGIFSSGEDVTEKRAIENSLRESEANLAAVLESAGDSIWSVDRNFRILTVNNKFREEFKHYYGVELKKGTDITACVPADEKEKWVKRYNKVLKGQSVNEIETFDLDQGKMIFEIWLNPIKEGVEVKGISVVTSNITSKQEAQEQLRELTERLKLAADSAKFGVWELDLVNNKLTWDEWMFKLYGTSPENFGVAYETWKKGVHPDDIEKTDHEVQLAINGEKDFDTEFRIIRPNKEIRYLKANAVITRDDAGRALKMTGINYDITWQKKAEAKLKRSESNYRLIIENQTDLVVKVDHEGKFMFVSPSYCQMFGKTAEELLGKAFMPLVHPDDRATTEEAMKEIYHPPHQAYMEQRAMTRDGWKWFGWEDKAILDENGEVKEIVGVGRDITVQKNAEQALTESEEKFKTLFELAPDAYYINDLKGRFIDGNKKAEELLGYNKDDLLGKDFTKLKLLPAIELPKALKGMAKNVLGKSTGPDEFQLIRKDGRKIPVEIQTQPVVMGGKKVVLGLARDISQRIERDKALKSSEERYRNLIETASDAIFLISDKGRFLEVNSTACKNLGYKQDELIGKEISEVDPNFDLGQFLEFWDKIPADQQHTFETNHQRKNGEIFPVEVSGKKYMVDGIFHFYGIARDITDRKLNEKALRESELFANAVANTTPALIYIYDVEKQQNIYTNEVHKKFFQNLEKSTDALTYHDISELTHPDDFAKLGEKSAEMIGNPEIDKYEVEIRLKHQGEWRWMLLTNSVFRKNEKGIATQVLGAMFDIHDRKKAEQSLKESETRFKALHNASFGGITIHDKGLILDCNKGLSEITGYSFEELIGMDGLLLIAEKSRKVVMDNILAEYEKPYEAFGLRKNGEQYPLQLEARMIPYKGKKARVVEFRDITKQKKAEAELMKAKEMAETSENRYRKAQEVGHIGSWEYDLINDQFWGSDEGKRMYGLDLNKDFFSSSEVMKLVDSADRDRVNQTMIDLIEKNKPYDIIFSVDPLNSNEQKIIRSLGELIRDENGVPVKVTGVLHDITTQKRTEMELVKAKEQAEEISGRLNAALESMSDAVFISDLTGAFINFNEAFATFHKFKTREECARTLDAYPAFLDVFYPDGKLLPLDRWAVNRALRGEYGINEEYHLKRKDTGETWIGSYNFGPVLDSNGKIIGSVVTARDITDKKKADQELIDAKEQAEESDRLKSAFLANMSHEIRTPMNGILGFADLLKEPELSGEQRDKYIYVIEKSGERMLNIINDLIDISKIEAGQVEYTPTETNLREQTEFLCSFFKPEMAKKGLDFKCLFPEESTGDILVTDREKLYAILANLLKNAVKYTPDGNVEFGYQEHKSNIRFFVKDTGIGVSEDRREAIFERFVQADIEDKKAMEGAGLGLAISKAYAKMLGGNIWVESNELGGSTFFLEIPAQNVQPNEGKVNEKEKPGMRQKSKTLEDAIILIAEDEETSDMYLTEILKNECREILHVISGRKAVDLVKAKPEISVVLMDIKMPEMNGYDATKEIRKFNREIIIIAQTAYALSGDREKALEAGCNDYLPKPVKKATLLETMNKHYKGEIS